MRAPYRTPETPATPAPRLRWTLRVPEGEVAENALIALSGSGGLLSLAVVMVFVVEGPTPFVLRGLLADVLVWALFCALFVRRVPEVKP